MHFPPFPRRRSLAPVSSSRKVQLAGLREQQGPFPSPVALLLAPEAAEKVSLPRSHQMVAPFQVSRRQAFAQPLQVGGSPTLAPFERRPWPIAVLAPRPWSSRDAFKASSSHFRDSLSAAISFSTNNLKMNPKVHPCHQAINGPELLRIGPLVFGRPPFIAIIVRIMAVHDLRFSFGRVEGQASRKITLPRIASFSPPLPNRLRPGHFPFRYPKKILCRFEAWISAQCIHKGRQSHHALDAAGWNYRYSKRPVEGKAFFCRVFVPPRPIIRGVIDETSHLTYLYPSFVKAPA